MTNPKPKKTFMKKIEIFFHKTTLVVAFAAAAGCATTSGNRFDSNEDLKREPDVCVDNTNPIELQKKIPEVAKDFSLMEKLPLTGKPVYDLLMNPVNNIASCIFYVEEGTPSTSTYKYRRIKVASNAGTTLLFHESFHAAQDINRKGLGTNLLTQKDTSAYLLLQEATAAAYEIAARQEAENHRFSFTNTSTNPENKKLTTVSDDPRVRNAFLHAYNEAWKSRPDMESSARAAQALGAGGKAVVRHLLDGKNDAWKSHYSDLVTYNIRNTLHYFKNDALKYVPERHEQRSQIYAKLGYISPLINFVPEEYLGPNAEASIDLCLKNMGIKTIPQPVPPKNPSGPAA